MRFHVVLLILLGMAASACTRPSEERRFTLHGQVVAVESTRQEATIKHDEIKGLMPAMTMPYKVRETKLLDGVAPGDVVDATLVIVPNDAYLVDVKKVGRAPLEQPPAEAPAASGSELLKPGERVPDAVFTDQDGRHRNFGSFRGQTVVLTFIYTRCPMPTFCPLMDRHFAAIQTKLKEAPLRPPVRLISVSFDPQRDTPPVLKKHAQTVGADPKMWSFLTGKRDDIDRFAARFGVSVVRAANDQRDITHNLRTAIVDPAGKIVKIYTGNEWTPDQILADLRKGAGV